MDAALSKSVSVAPSSEHGEKEQAADSVKEKIKKSKQEGVLVREGNENGSESDSFSDTGGSDLEGFQLVKDLKVEEKKSIHIKLSAALQSDNSQEAAQTATTSVSELEESYSEHVNSKTVMSADSTVTYLNLKETALSSEEVGEGEREEGSEGSERERRRSKRERSSRSDRKKKKKHRKQKKRDQNSHSHHRGSSRSPYKSQSRSHSYSRSRSRSRSRL